MTITELAPRLADRSSSPGRAGVATVRRLGRATVTQLPVAAAARRRRTSGADLVLESLSFMLVQADGFSRDVRLPERDRIVFTGQVQAYAFAMGISVHPDDPESALQIKRDILAVVSGGAADPAEIRATAVAEVILPDDAC